MNPTLKTNRDFESLSIPLEEDEQMELENSLIQNGCREPVIVWNGTILDGHKRYKFCSREKIGYEVKEMDFPSRYDAICWVCRTKLGQFEKNTVVYRYLIGRLFGASKNIFLRLRNCQRQKKDGSLEWKQNLTAGEIAKEYEIDMATVSRYPILMLPFI